MLWERSALRYVDRVKTPVMFIHGENDNDVPIAEAEQFYIALKDVGVERSWCATRAKATACAKPSTSSTLSIAASRGTRSTSTRPQKSTRPSASDKTGRR